MNKIAQKDYFERVRNSWNHSRKSVGRRTIDGLGLGIALYFTLGPARAIQAVEEWGRGFDIGVITQMLAYLFWASTVFLVMPFIQFRQRGHEINVWILETITGSTGISIGLCVGLSLPILFEVHDQRAIRTLILAPVLWIGLESIAFYFCLTRHISEVFYGPTPDQDC